MSDTTALQGQYQAIMDQMNQQELSMYKFSSQASFEQSMSQTLGGLAMDAAKAKPQV